MRLLKNGFLILAVCLLLLSSWPLFLMARETYIHEKIATRYEIEHADTSQGFPTSLNVQQLALLGIDIKVKEIQTGKTAPLTVHDQSENVPAGNIVQVQWYVNGQPVSKADEIWRSNRDTGARYYSWLDVLQVKDRETNREKLVLVQRLTDDNLSMHQQAWKLIWVERDGSTIEENITYAERSNYPLAVRAINISATTPMSIGYHSDLMHFYPTLYYPILYPGASAVLGLLFLVMGLITHVKKGGKA